jgi:L-ascorbate metabolism protein UlaG (beta-lactamase superfamily)
MEINFLGHACFLLRGRKVRVLTDPFGQSIGLRQRKVKADIVTLSHQHDDHNDLSRVEGEPMVIQGPGEYEIKEVSILGISTYHDEEEGKLRGKNTIYVIDIDDLRVCHLGDLGHELSQQQLDQLDGVDVLLVPVGGFYTLEAKKALEIIKQIGPTIVIPMHFKTKGMTAAFDKLISVDEFLQLAGINGVRKEKSLSLKKTELPEEMEIVLLERKV